MPMITLVRSVLTEYDTLETPASLNRSASSPPWGSSSPLMTRQTISRRWKIPFLRAHGAPALMGGFVIGLYFIFFHEIQDNFQKLLIFLAAQKAVQTRSRIREWVRPA